MPRRRDRSRFLHVASLEQLGAWRAEAGAAFAAHLPDATPAQDFADQRWIGAWIQDLEDELARRAGARLEDSA